VPSDPAEEAARQERAARVIAAMKVDLAVLGTEPRSKKGSGWLVPVVLVGALIIAMLVGLNILKKMSGRMPPAIASQPTGAPVVERSPGDQAPTAPEQSPAAPVVDPGASALAQQASLTAEELARAGNWPALVAHSRKWMQIEPDRVEPLQYLGMAQSRLGDFSASADALTQALARDPSSGQTRGLLADVYLQGGRHVEAIGLYEQIVATTPNDARMWNNYGTALMGAGQSAQAIAAYETAVRIDPNFRSAWNSLGNAYRAAGDNAKATAAFANAR
jgi:tetratricopeptide (TPR) repeat protein